MDSDAKRLKKAWLADQKAAARAAFPLPEGHLAELFRDLEDALMEAGCDHSLTLTRRWLSDHKVDPHGVLEWLGENGGHCDCEVVANAGDHFENNRAIERFSK